MWFIIFLSFLTPSLPAGLGARNGGLLASSYSTFPAAKNLLSPFIYSIVSKSSAEKFYPKDDRILLKDTEHPSAKRQDKGLDWTPFSIREMIFFVRAPSTEGISQASSKKSFLQVAKEDSIFVDKRRDPSSYPVFKKKSPVLDAQLFPSTTSKEAKENTLSTSVNKNQKVYQSRNVRSVGESCHSHHLQNCRLDVIQKFPGGEASPIKCKIREEFLDCMVQQRKKGCPSPGMITAPTDTESAIRDKVKVLLSSANGCLLF